MEAWPCVLQGSWCMSGWETVICANLGGKGHQGKVWGLPAAG